MSKNPEAGTPADQSSLIAVPVDIERPQVTESVKTGVNLAARAVTIFGLSLGGGIATAISESFMAPQSAYADTTFVNDYPDMDAMDCSTVYGVDSWCKGNPPTDISPRKYGYRNCTDGVAYWVAKYTGYTLPDWGNADLWAGKAPASEVIAGTTKTDIEPGDIAQSNDGSLGHVGFVVVVKKNADGTVASFTTAELNKENDGNYTTNTYNTRNSAGKFIRGTNEEWDNFIDVNGAGKGLNNEPISDGSSISPVVDTLITPDGVHHVYSGTSSGQLYETWWSANSPTPTTWRIGSVGTAITGISAQETADGVEHVYYGDVTGTIGELYWGPGNNTVRAGQQFNSGVAVTALASELTADGEEHVYSANALGEVDEMSWGPNTAEVTTQVADISADITAISPQVTSDGTEHVFFGTQDGHVGEIWYPYGTNASHVDAEASVGSAVVSVSSQITADNIRHIYSAEANGDIDETYWGPTTSETTWRWTNVGVEPTAISSQITFDGTEHVLFGTSFGETGDLWYNGTNGVHLDMEYTDPTAVAVSGLSSAVSPGDVLNIDSANAAGTLLNTWEITTSGQEGTSPIASIQ